jgi:ubiquitin C-terminal hydrolase
LYALNIYVYVASNTGLNGVIIHEGCTGNKGHYTYQLLIDSNWFELDDESIKYVDHSQAMENNRQGTLYIYTQDKQVQEVSCSLPTQTRCSERLQSNNHSNTTPETKSNPNLPARLCGLVNKGVDCYANASIQCLLSLEKVSEYMDKDNNGGDNLLISTFRRLKVEYDKKKNVCAQEFINMMISKHPNELESGRQCMASDFLSLAIKDLGIGELFNYEFHSKVDCHTCGPTVDGTAFIHKAETFLYVNPSRNSLLETLIK